MKIGHFDNPSWFFKYLDKFVVSGHIFTLICCKICIVCLKRPIINEKEAEDGPFKKRNIKKEKDNRK